MNEYPQTLPCPCCKEPRLFPTNGAYRAAKSTRAKANCSCNGNHKKKLMWIDKVHAKFGDRIKATMDWNDYKTKCICKKHGEFWITMGHLMEGGCPTCNLEDGKGGRKMTTVEYVSKCKEVHGDLYDYSKVKYDGGFKDIKVICKEHGVFKINPRVHLFDKRECYICYPKGRFSKDEIDFMDHIGIEEESRQIRIGKYTIDGMMGDTVYEYLGDLWHGNINSMFKDKFGKMMPQGKSANELRNDTENKLTFLKYSGYNVNYIWETDWINFKAGKYSYPNIRNFDGTLQLT